MTELGASFLPHDPALFAFLVGVILGVAVGMALALFVFPAVAGVLALIARKLRPRRMAAVRRRPGER